MEVHPLQVNVLLFLADPVCYPRIFAELRLSGEGGVDKVIEVGYLVFRERGDHVSKNGLLERDIRELRVMFIGKEIAILLEGSRITRNVEPPISDQFIV